MWPVAPITKTFMDADPKQGSAKVAPIGHGRLRWGATKAAAVPGGAGGRVPEQHPSRCTQLKQPKSKSRGRGGLEVERHHCA